MDLNKFIGKPGTAGSKNAASISGFNDIAKNAIGQRFVEGSNRVPTNEVLYDQTRKSELDEQRINADKQWWGEQLWNSAYQLGVNEIFYGTLKAFGDIYDAVAHAGNPDDFTNKYSTYFEDLQEKVRESHPIYQKTNEPGLHFNDFGWIANGLVNIGSTVSLMIPGQGIVGGVSKLAKAAGGLKLAYGLGKVAKGVGLTTSSTKATNAIVEGTKAFSSALLSRMAENYQEGREVYKAVYDDALNQLNNMSDEEYVEFLEKNKSQLGDTSSKEAIASQLATEAGNKTYKNDYWMLLMDIPQVAAVNKAFKRGTAGATSNLVRRAEILAEEQLKTGKNFELIRGPRALLQKDFWQAAERGAKQMVKNPLTSWEAFELGEGVEEGFQGIQSKRSEEQVKLYFNPYLERETLMDYITDPEIYEQAFWGVVGGIGFKGAASGFHNIKNRAGILWDQKIAKDKKLTNEDIEGRKLGFNKAQVNEIRSRFTNLQKAISKFKLVEQGYNPYSPSIDANGKQTKDRDNEPQFEKIQSLEDYERIKKSVVNDYLETLVVNASQSGDLQLLKEFISNPEFSKYVKEQGLDLDVLDNTISQTINEIEEDYEQARLDLINNVSNGNIFLINAAASKLMRQRRLNKEYDTTLESINDQLAVNSGELSSDNNEDYQKILEEVIKQRIELLENAKIAFEKQYKDKDNLYTKAAYDVDVKTINNQLKALYSEYASLNEGFRGIENLKPILKDAGLNVTDETLGLVQKEYNNFVKNLNTNNPSSTIDPASRKLLIRKAVIASEQIMHNAKLPETKTNSNRYQEYYDNQEAVHIELANSKFGKAFDRVQKYIENSNDIDEALNNIKTGNVNKRLNNSLDILRFGSTDRSAYTALLEMLVNAERKRRNEYKENENKIDTNEGTISGEQATHVENKVNPSSTGEESNIPVEENEAEDIAKEDARVADEQLKEENVELEREGADVLAEQIEQERIERSLLTDEQIITEGRDIAIKINSENPELFKRVMDEGINSEPYLEFVQRIADKLVVEKNVNPDDANRLAGDALNTFIYLANYIDKNAAKNVGATNQERSKKLNKLVEDIGKIITGTNISNNRNSLFDEIGDDKSELYKEFLEDYIFERKLKSSNGKYEIDVADLFNYISVLCDEEDITYDFLVDFFTKFKDVVNFIKENKNNPSFSKYIIKNENLINKNVNVILDYIFNAKTERVSLDNYSGAPTSTGLSAKDKAKLDRYQGKPLNFVDTGNSISIRLQDGTEVAFLAKVTPNDTNTRFEKYSIKGIPEWIEINQDGTISYTYDKLIDAIFDNEFLFSYFKEAFIIGSGNYDYNTKQTAKQFVFDKNNIRKFVENEVVKEYLNQIPNFNYKEFINSIGETSSPKLISQLNSLLNFKNVLFYDLNSRAKNKQIDFNETEFIKNSYELYKTKVLNNFKTTVQIEDSINQDLENSTENITAIYRGRNAYEIRYGEEHDVSDLNLKNSVENYPIVYVDGSSIISENNDEWSNRPDFRTGTMGIVIDDRRNNDLVNTGTANVALLTSGNLVFNGSKESEKIGKAVRKYITNAITKYNNIVKDDSQSLNNKNAAFEELYQTLSNLFGKTENKVFDGISIIADKNRNFISLAYEGEDGMEIIGTFHKYDSKIRTKDGLINTETGQKATDEELRKHMRAGLTVGKAFTYDITSENGKKLVDKILNGISENMTFNKSRYAVSHRKDVEHSSEHFFKDKNGFGIKIGDEVFRYKNFTEFVIKNNAFKTTQIGRNVSQMSNSAAETSRIYFEIVKTTTPVSQEEKEDTKERLKNIQSRLKEKGIRKDVPIKTDELIDAIKLSDEEVRKYSRLKNSGLDIIPDEIILSNRAAKGERGSSRTKDGRIKITNLGLETIASNDKNAIRLLVHEQLHNKIREQKFFKGKKGQLRIEQLKNIYDKLKDYATKNNYEPIIKFLDEFEKAYDYETEPALFAEEFLIEAFSQRQLVNVLNEIDSGEVLTINGVEEHKTLLRKILDFIVDLFTEGGIKTNSLLNKVENIVDDIYPLVQVESSLFVTENNEIEIKEQTPKSPVEEESTETKDIVQETPTTDDSITHEVAPESVDEKVTEDETEENDEEYGVNPDDLVDFSLFDEIGEMTNKDDIILEDFNNDKLNNPYGLESVENMEDYIKKYKATERDSMRSAMAQNELKYSCR